RTTRLQSVQRPAAAAHTAILVRSFGSSRLAPESFISIVLYRTKVLFANAKWRSQLTEMVAGPYRALSCCSLPITTRHPRPRVPRRPPGRTGAAQEASPAPTGPALRFDVRFRDTV